MAQREFFIEEARTAKLLAATSMRRLPTASECNEKPITLLFTPEALRSTAEKTLERTIIDVKSANPELNFWATPGRA